LTGGVKACAGKPNEPFIHNIMIPNHSHSIEAVAARKAGDSKRFRRLKWNELPKRGDFVEDGNRSFEPWEGPGGFRADSFVKPIYRKLAHRPVLGGKTPSTG
jgi:hypothetical protein